MLITSGGTTLFTAGIGNRSLPTTALCGRCHCATKIRLLTACACSDGWCAMILVITWASPNPRFVVGRLTLANTRPCTWCTLPPRRVQQLSWRWPFFTRSGSLMCENNSLGGEAASSGTPHYLYVAVRESGLLRGNYREPKRSRFGSCDVAEDIRRWGGGRWGSSLEHCLPGATTT